MNFSFFFIFFSSFYHIHPPYPSKYKQHTFHFCKASRANKKQPTTTIQPKTKKQQNPTNHPVLPWLCLFHPEWASCLLKTEARRSREECRNTVSYERSLRRGAWRLTLSVGTMFDVHSRSPFSRHFKPFLATPGCWRALGDRWQSGLWDVSTVVFVLGDCCCWSFVFKRLLHSLGVWSTRWRAVACLLICR